jgi:predicted NBD/HSP70 family sugar kinase
MFDDATAARELELPLQGGGNASAIVLDVGGTTTRIGRVDWESSDPGRAHLTFRRIPTPNHLTSPHSPEAIVSRLQRDIRKEICTLTRDRTPHVIVVGYPGPIDQSGTALRSPTILGESSHRVPVAGFFNEDWPEVPVRVHNDLTCAGYAFIKRGHRDFCVLTVGSGIGNKVFLNACPHVGNEGFGGEIGHLKVSPKPGNLISDVHDDLGAIASGRGAVRFAQLWATRAPADFARSALSSLLLESSHDLWSTQLVSAFRAHDAFARTLIETISHPLAAAMAHLHLGLGLVRFFVTGGFAAALGSDYRDLLTRQMAQLSWQLGQPWDRMVTLSEMAQEDGLIGAAYLASRDVTLARNARARRTATETLS